VRGPGGGYNLARKADEVAVADIILAVDEPIDATQCGGKENCLDEQKCLTHDLWTNLNSHIFDYLRGVKLADLVKQNQERLRQAGVAELQDRRPKRRPETVTV
jgi:Rrf2 family iron-sulfur cluster assembly transcriptional regulator